MLHWIITIITIVTIVITEGHGSVMIMNVRIGRSIN